jgi:hypothetical protein
MYKRACVHEGKHAHVHIHTHIHTYTHTHTDIHIHSWIHTHTYTYTHTNTHTSNYERNLHSTNLLQGIFGKLFPERFRFVVYVRKADSTDLVWNSFVRPFSLGVWVSLIGCLLTLSVAFLLIERFWPQCRRREGLLLEFPRVLFSVMKPFCWQGAVLIWDRNLNWAFRIIHLLHWHTDLNQIATATVLTTEGQFNYIYALRYKIETHSLCRKAAQRLTVFWLW